MEATLSTYALALTRIERAAHALDAVELGLDGAAAFQRKGEDDLLFSLQQNLRSWIGTATRLASELGLTPSAAARIAKDVGIGAHAAGEHIALLEKYRRAS